MPDIQASKELVIMPIRVFIAQNQKRNNMNVGVNKAFIRLRKLSLSKVSPLDDGCNSVLLFTLLALIFRRYSVGWDHLCSELLYVNV